MDKESAVLLNAVAGLKLNLTDVKGYVDMCKAWEDYAKERGKEYAREYAREYAKDYVKENEVGIIKSLIRSGIPYEIVRKSLREVTEEELKQLYEESEKELAAL